MSEQIAQPIPLVMTTAEVAELLRCSIATVERYVFAHELFAIRIGRERRFRGHDIVDFVARRPNTIRVKKTRQNRPRRDFGTP